MIAMKNPGKLSEWTLLLAAILILTGCHKEIFVECESFEQKGGWVVDPQFVEQMGSP